MEELDSKDQLTISIHALREEGDINDIILIGLGKRISIHALREEGDDKSSSRSHSRSGFLSTPSARRATVPFGNEYLGDLKFLSTPSARRATASGELAAAKQKLISIHALREEGDWLPVREAQRRPISIHALREEGD